MRVERFGLIDCGFDIQPREGLILVISHPSVAICFDGFIGIDEDNPKGGRYQIFGNLDQYMVFGGRYWHTPCRCYLIYNLENKNLRLEVKRSL